MNIGTIKPIDIEHEMKWAYLDYAMSVIVARALPDARDGLKPVHRRILYGMHDMGVRHDKPYRKSARIVGDVLGKYHPHGDAAVYDAMARMAQDFSMRYLLVDGQGNFGSIDGDSPAAMRYTEARLTRIAEELLADIEKETVNWSDNFDGSLKEPDVLPARLPNLLLNGATGIAVGMATNIPPHNLGELCDGICYMIDHWETSDDILVEELMQFIKGPDFPTGGLIIGREGIVNGYATGKGQVVVRGVAHIEEGKVGRQRIVITEIPYQVNKSGLVERIADLVRTDRIKDIADLRDESDRNGLSIVIELKRASQPLKVLNQLYKFSPLQSNISINMLALLHGETRLLPLKKALQAFIEHRIEVINRRSQFELEKARQRAHILEGLLIALNHLDEVIQTIRQSPDAETARPRLMSKFNLSEVQANAILDMQLRRLAALERQKIEDEYKEVQGNISYLEDLLAHPQKILSLIQEETRELKADYADERRTRIMANENAIIDEEDLITDEQVLVTITSRGYIKRVSSQAYRTQARGGIGVTGMTTREEDVVRFMFQAGTMDTVLYFSDRGKVYSEKAHRIPDASRSAKGVPLVNLINLASEERITAVLPVPNFNQARYLTMVTRRGKIKRTMLKEFESVRPSGLIALTLMENDTLGWVKLTSGEDDLLLVTAEGQAIRFQEGDVRVMGRTAAGVTAMKLKGTDTLAGMEVIRPERDLMLVTALGYGKRTSLAEYNTQHRGGGGVRTIGKNLKKTGRIVDTATVSPDEDVLLISSEGMAMRTKVKAIPSHGRAASGVVVMRLHKEDQVVSLALLAAQDIKQAAKDSTTEEKEPETE